MSDQSEQNELISYFKYLDDLSKDKDRDMSGAALNLITDFGVWPPKARSVLAQWMKTRGKGKSVEARVGLIETPPEPAK